MVFSEDVVKIVCRRYHDKWIASDKGHNVEFIGGPEGATLPAKSGLNKDVSMTFDKAGVIFICLYSSQSNGHDRLGSSWR